MSSYYSRVGKYLKVIPSSVTVSRTENSDRENPLEKQIEDLFTNADGHLVDHNCKQSTLRWPLPGHLFPVGEGPHQRDLVGEQYLVPA